VTGPAPRIPTAPSVPGARTPPIYALRPEARLTYLHHGDTLLTYDLPAKTLARVANVTEWSVRMAREFGKVYGPPKDIPWRVVVLGDAHFSPSYESPAGALHRARALGEVVAAELRSGYQAHHRLAFVVMGDWHDFPALSAYDKGKTAAWGRTYAEDLEFGNAAADVLVKTIAAHAPTAWSAVERKDFHTGNHEYRIARVLEDDGRLGGTMGLHDLPWDQLGFTVYPFLTPGRIEDVWFCHYFEAGNSSRAIASVNMGRQLTLQTLSSVVVAHNHLYKTDRLTRPTDGAKLVSTTVGCCFEHYLPWAK
jgi:hypothetical protein